MGIIDDMYMGRSLEEWTDFEPFSAFIFHSASWIVIVIALLFIAISFIITRPYCRFVCPMGTLLKFAQTSIVK